MTFDVLTHLAESVERFAKAPLRSIRESDGEAILVLSQNKPAFYAVPPARYRAMLDLIDAAVDGSEHSKARG